MWCESLCYCLIVMKVNLLLMCGVNHCCTLAVKIEVFFVSYNLLAGCFAGAIGFSTL